MTVTRAFLDGIGRVNRAKTVLAAVFVLTFLLALPLGLVLRGMIADHLGASLEANSAATGVNLDWWQEFASQATGLGRTFTPGVIGSAAVLGNLSALLDNRPQAAVIVGAGAVYVLLWIFLVGGVIDRYARDRPVRTHGFFAACGVFFFRFLRLGVAAGLAYFVLYRFVHAWLFDGLYQWAIRDLSVERTAFVLRLSLYGVFLALLSLFNLVFDYAKIRAVVEDRRSMIGAMVAGARFVARHPGALVLYVLDAVLFGGVLLAYLLVAPGARGAGWQVLTALVVGQAYLLARLWVRLVFFASQTAYFQGALAHAGYVATRQPVWPESPAAESLSPP